MTENRMQQEQTHSMDVGPISWWSWRPGMKPEKALFAGAVFALVGLALAASGLVTLVLGILDGNSPPLQLPGTVTSHSTVAFDNLPHLTIHLHAQGFPDQVMPAVPVSAAHSISDGAHVLVDYSPRLHFLYAIESQGRRYPIPGSSAAGNPFGSLALFFLGAVICPYPMLLTLLAWRDLNVGRGGRKKQQMRARVVGLRAAISSGTRRTGMMPVPSRSWHGVALQPLDSRITQQVMSFSIPEYTYALLHEGDTVEITYSPHLHYVYSISVVEAAKTGKAGKAVDSAETAQ